MLRDLFFKDRANWILPTFRFFYPAFIALELSVEKQSLVSKVQSPLCYPIPLFRHLSIPILQESNIDLFYYTLIFSLIFLSFGFITQLSGIISSVLFFLIIGSAISCSTGKNPDYIPWNHAIVFFNLFVLGISPSNRNLSIDKYLFRFNSAQQKNWPIFLLKFNLIYSYFSSSLAKLQNGFDWMNGYSLQAQLIYRHLNLDTPLALPIINSHCISVSISITVVLMEFLSPFALLNRSFATFFISGSLLFQMIFALLIELKWMHYFGWAYLIYFLEFIAILNILTLSRLKSVSLS